MISIEKNGITYGGSKQQIIVDFINLVYSIKEMADLKEDEIVRLEKCFSTMLRQGDVTHLTNQFNLEQRKDIIKELYQEVGIKPL